MNVPVRPRANQVQYAHQVPSAPPSDKRMKAQGFVTKTSAKAKLKSALCGGLVSEGRYYYTAYPVQRATKPKNSHRFVILQPAKPDYTPRQPGSGV
jgi:hypothetical protein